MHKLLFYLFLLPAAALAQKAGIGTANPESSALLDVSSTSKGILIPRMTTEQRNSVVSPVIGLQIFNTDNQCINIYDGSNWIESCGLKVTGTATDANHSVNSWLQKADFVGTASLGAVGFSINNKGYIGTGGPETNTGLRELWQYDPLVNAWSQKADFGGAGRTYAAAFSANGKGYLGTGSGLRDFWEYDPITNTWLQKADFGGTGRSGAVGFSIGNKGYIGTGTGTSAEALKDFWEYDPITNTWLQKADFGGLARWYATGFSIGNKGYIGMGQISLSRPDATGDSSVKDFWEYNPLTNAWLQKADFGGVQRQRAAGFSLGSKGYAGIGESYFSINGFSSFTSRKDFWQYNPAADNWVQKATFPTFSNPPTSFSIGNRGYVYAVRGDKWFWEYMDDNTSGFVYSPGIISTGAGNIISDGAWAIQNNNIYTANNGNVGIGITPPRAKLHVSNGALLVDNCQATHSQGAYIEWNKDFSGGKTYLLNQRGLGAGGIVLGEVDNNNNVIINCTLDAGGSLTLRGNHLSASDARMKTNIARIANPMDILLLHGCNYHWKDSSKDSTLQTGVLAQEVQKVFPNLVRENTKGELSVNYQGLIPVIIEAMKNEDKKIKEEIGALKASHTAIRQDIDNIKKRLGMLPAQK